MTSYICFHQQRFFVPQKFMKNLKRIESWALCQKFESPETPIDATKVGLCCNQIIVLLGNKWLNSSIKSVTRVFFEGKSIKNQGTVSVRQNAESPKKVKEAANFSKCRLSM